VKLKIQFWSNIFHIYGIYGIKHVLKPKTYIFDLKMYILAKFRETILTQYIPYIQNKTCSKFHKNMKIGIFHLFAGPYYSQLFFANSFEFVFFSVKEYWGKKVACRMLIELTPGFSVFSSFSPLVLLFALSKNLTPIEVCVMQGILSVPWIAGYEWVPARIGCFY